MKKTIGTMMLALVSGAVLAAAPNAQIEADYKAAVTQCKAGPSADRKPCIKKAKQERREALACRTCGVISNVNVTEVEGERSIAGMAAGAVVGGVLGHQIGKGKGKDLATVAGAAGGAYAGNEVAKKLTSTKTYEYTIALNNGTTTVIRLEKQDKDPGFAVGQKVKVEGTTLVAR